jgi:Ser/Thr protein kinase RdoA (MazF antagonist)
MPLGAQALAEFDLPAAPQRTDELPSPVPGAVLRRIHAPAGRFLLLWSDAALGVAFETTLFDLLAEARFPAPRPRRTRDGSMIARLAGPSRTAAAACYPWPPGDELSPAAASVPQLMEIGRLLARLHQLGETHPVSVPDPWTPVECPPELAAVLSAGIPPLPSGAVHGGLVPARALFIGDRCSSVMPSGAACSAALVLDLAESALGWLLESPRPVAAVRAVVSGYQSLRRLLPEEQGGLFAALRFAAAREGARRGGTLGPLRAVDAIGEAEVRAATGAP